MDELELDVTYEDLALLLHMTKVELIAYDLQQVRVVKVVDKPSILPDNDRITIHIDLV